MQIENPQHLAVISLFLRALSAFSSTVILLEKGLLEDAGTVIRSAIESTIYLKAAVVEENFLKEIDAANQNTRLKLANIALQKEEGGIELTSESEPRLQAIKIELDSLKQQGLLKDIDVRSVAAKTGLLGIYNTGYRLYSNTNAHPSASSLKRYLKFNSDGSLQSALWRPESDDLDSYMYSICACIAVCFTTMTELFELDKEIECNLQARLDTAISNIKSGAKKPNAED